MKLKKGLVAVISTTLLLGILAGCGNENKNGTNSSSSGGDSKVIKVATQTPLSGNSATLGEAIKLGAQLALEDQKAEFEKLGFKLELQPYDDQGDPKKGVSNANIIGADKSVLAIVGHLNSGVAIPSSEVYEKYSLPMVSPANTATAVTDRKLKTVNRIVARDDFQGPAGADYAMDKLGAKKIFVVQDKTAYGQGLADAFKKAAEEKGAEILGYEGITVGEKDFNGVVTKIAAKKPDLVYFGGLYAEGGLLIKQARAKGIKVPFMGGDGLDSSTLVDIAADGVKNVYYTSVAGDAMTTDKGKVFAEAYKKKFGKNIEGYSAYGYDSMGVVLQGIKESIKANSNKLPTREQVRDAIRKTADFEGIITKAGFDDIGDNKYAKVFIYKFDEPKYPGILDGQIEKK
ncbi:MAG: branched-chain amino acid ABC transporter substrate-binding protein [Bacillaceae bacterium]